MTEKIEYENGKYQVTSMMRTNCYTLGKNGFVCNLLLSTIVAITISKLIMDNMNYIYDDFKIFIIVSLGILGGSVSFLLGVHALPNALPSILGPRCGIEIISPLGTTTYIYTDNPGYDAKNILDIIKKHRIAVDSKVASEKTLRDTEQSLKDACCTKHNEVMKYMERDSE